MSRCFPYPPPGYVRYPVAVAEAETTAKLQKKREKAEKKEKRSDRKALQQGETSKHSKHGHKKRKHGGIATAEQEPKTLSQESVEQLEKSGLSEEHGAPFFVRAARDSPESSQDSSKRRKIVLPSPSQAKNGSILRIKIKRDQDSPRGVEQPSVKQMGLALTQLSKPNSIQQHDNVNINSAAASHRRINVEPQATEKQVITHHPSKLMRRDDQHMVKVVQQLDSKLPVKPPVGKVDLQPVRVDPPLVKMAQKDLPSKALPAKVLHRVEREATGINQLQGPSSSMSKEEPSSSGRNVEAVQAQEAKLSKSDRKKSRKAQKEEKKFRDLFVTWKPPSFEMKDSDVCEPDWLFGSTRNSDARMTNCRASDGSVPFQSIEQQPSLQPKATFLPDLHIFQLPYVVPY